MTHYVGLTEVMYVPREAALAYFTTGGLSYINGQEDETVAAINYLETVIGNVSNKEDPGKLILNT